MSNKLSDKCPELIQEWSERNLPLSFYDITYGSNKLYWWNGKCGHEWQASAKSRSSGENCPICSGARVIQGINDLVTMKPEIASEWSIKNEPLKPSMVTIGSHKKVIWHGKCGHEWSATIKSRTVNHTGCPYCSHNTVLPGFNDLATLFPSVASEWSERNYPLKPDMVTAFTNRKLWWKCEKGHEWNSLVSTRSYGSNCPYCSGVKILKGFNDLATTQPELIKEWSAKNGSLSPDMTNEKSTKMVWWKCRECGFEWRSCVKTRVHGSLCPVCSEREVHAGYNDLATTDPMLAREWDTEKNQRLCVEKVSRNSLYSVWWKCSNGHSWKARIADRAINHETCLKCEDEFQSVFPELLISLYAKRKGVQVLLHSEKPTGIPVDLFIPELNMAIDCFAPTNGVERNCKTLIKFICSKNNIDYFQVPYMKNEIQYVGEIKKLFLQKNIILLTDGKQDIKVIRELFMNWRGTY